MAVVYIVQRDVSVTKNNYQQNEIYYLHKQQ